MAKRTATQSIIYTLGGALPAIAGFVLITPLTIYLSPDQYGVQALYLTLSILMQVFITYGLDQYLVRNYIVSGNVEEKQAFVSKVITLIFTLGLISIGVFSIVGDVLFYHVLDTPQVSFWPFGLLAIGNALMNAVVKVYTNLMVYQQAPYRFLFINVLNTVLMIVGIYGGLILYPDSPVGPVAGRTLASVICALVVIMDLVRRENLRISFGMPKNIHSFCFNVMLFGFVIWGMSYGNNLLVHAYFTDLSQLAIFDIVLKFVLIIDLIQNGTTTAISPKLYKIWHEGRTKLEERRVHELFNVLSIVAISGSIVALPILSPFLLRQAFYQDAIYFFPAFALGHMMRSSLNFFVTPMYFHEKTRRLPWVFALSFFIHIITAVFMIEWLGLMGAFISLAVSKLIQVILLALFNRDIEFDKNDFLTVFFVPLLYASAASFLFFLLGYSIAFMLVLMLISAACILLFYMPTVSAFIRGLKSHDHQA